MNHKFCQYFLFLLVGFFICQSVSAQIDKKVNHVFLWDVTQSMKGVYHDKATGKYNTNKANDIYADVQNVIVNVINGIEEGAGDIIIIPFQDKVIEDKTFATTPEGIQAAISYVKNYNNEDITYTNICSAWEYSFDKIKRNDKNLIYLLTDGEQSDLSKRNPKWGIGCVSKMVSAYCNLVKDYKFTYTFYISLNTNLSSVVKNAICQTCPDNLRCSEGTPPSQIIDIQPNRLTQVVNIQDGDLSFTQDFDVKGNLPEAFNFNALLSIPSGQLPDGTSIKLKQIRDLKIQDGKTTFALNISPAMLKQLQKTAPEEIKGTIFYNKPNLEKLGLGGQIIEFTPNKVDLIIRNRREKTLKITILD